MLFLTESAQPKADVDSKRPLTSDEQELLRSYAAQRLRSSAYLRALKPGPSGLEIAMALTTPLTLALPLIGLLLFFG